MPINLNTSLTSAPSAPALSNFTQSVGPTSVLLGADIDGAGDILYALTDADVTLSAAQIDAATDGSIVSSGTTSAGSAGTYSLGNVTGLTASTNYWVHRVSRISGPTYGTVDKRQITTSAAGSVTVTNTITRSNDQVAPDPIRCAISISGLGLTQPAGSSVYDPDFHQALIVTHFDDAGAFNVMAHKLPEWDDKSVGFGPMPCHIYDTPGTYTVQTHVYDPATRTLVASSTPQVITVGDPDTAFPGTRTICVADDSDFTGAPSGADTYSTLSAGLSAYRSLGSTGRLLMKAGGSYEFGSDNDIDNRYPNFRLGSWGSGARPSVSLSTYNGPERNGMAVTKDMVLHDHNYDGPYSTVTETGALNDGPGFMPDTASCGFNGIMNVKVTGSDICQFYQSEGTIIMQGFEILDFRNFGILASVNDAYIGFKDCRIHRDPLASAGPTSSNSSYSGNIHGPVRLSQTGTNGRVYMDGIDLYGNAGWSDQGQACIRISRGDTTNGFRLWCSRFYCEGGGGTQGTLSLESSAGSGEDHPSNIHFDMGFVVGHHRSRRLVHRSYGATEFTNTHFICPNAAYSSDNNWQGIHNFSDQGNDADNLVEPVRTVACTHVSLRDFGGGSNSTGLLEKDGIFNDESFINCIHEGPNIADTEDTGDTPFTLEDTMAPYAVSYQYEGDRTPDYSYGSPTHQLDYTGTAPSAGDVLTGGTSGATARVIEDNSGTLELCEVSGTFQNGESLGGGMTANGTLVDLGVVAVWTPTAASSAYEGASESGSNYLPVNDIRTKIRASTSTRGCVDPNATAR